MTDKNTKKKRKTITFQPDADVAEMLKKFKIPQRERSRIINQALKEVGPTVIKRHDESRRLFLGAAKDKREDTH